MGVASFRVAEAETSTTDWVAAPVDQATGSVGRGDGRSRHKIGGPDLRPRSEPFGPDDEAVLALLARMASVALERAALYETLRSNEQRLTVLVESSPLAIAELDLDGTVRWWNRAAGYLFGWDESGLAPRTIPVAGEAAVMLDALWDRARLGMATVGALVPARRPGGELMELSLSVAPLEENDGSTGGILAVAEDATEREQVLEQFHRSQRLGAMARLAGGIAHDFNNLVTVILASSETLMRRIGPDDPLRAEVEAIHRVGKRAAALTGQLLQIGHRSSLQLVETDPSEVIAAMSDDLRRLFGPHVEVEITTDTVQSQLARPGRPRRAGTGRCSTSRSTPATPCPKGDASRSTRVSRATKRAPNAGWSSPSRTPGSGWTHLPPSTASSRSSRPREARAARASDSQLSTPIVTQSNGSVNVESTPGVGDDLHAQISLCGQAGRCRRGEPQASKR